jgi:hypothetical protein
LTPRKAKFFSAPAGKCFSIFLVWIIAANLDESHANRKRCAILSDRVRRCLIARATRNDLEPEIAPVIRGTM